MKKINHQIIEDIVKEVAPKVEEFTKWNLHLNTLNLKIVQRKDVWGKVDLPYYESLGLNVEPRTKKGEISLHKEKKYCSYSCLACYVPHNNTVYFVPQNIDTSQTGFKTIMAHELVHSGQFCNNSKFLDNYKFLVKKVVGENLFDDMGQKEIELSKEYGPFWHSYQALIEGDAYFVASELAKINGWDPHFGMRPFAHFMRKFLFRLYGWKETEKIKHKNWKDGERIICLIYDTKGRSEINRLYDLDIKEFYDYFHLKIINSSRP